MSSLDILCANYFNSHPREGGDVWPSSVIPTRYISILTPVKGVTNSHSALSNRLANFNSHPREGGDSVLFWTCPFLINFNSHPREGGDPYADSCCSHYGYFNSHPREGGDFAA